MVGEYLQAWHDEKRGKGVGGEDVPEESVVDRGWERGEEQTGQKPEWRSR
jgi:hypothetical protein